MKERQKQAMARGKKQKSIERMKKASHEKIKKRN